MRRVKVTLLELMKQNKEELLRNKEELERIEQRIEEKHASSAKSKAI
ncbi:FbpB family small basic protein [Bacillus coahuilensis]|nr:FbpB family small basic protein [Bacillus coahuilensis]